MGPFDVVMYGRLFTAALALLAMAVLLDACRLRLGRAPAAAVPAPAAAVPASAAAVSASAAAAPAGVAPSRSGVCAVARYDESLRRAAQRYGVAPATRDELSQPLVGGVELRGSKVLRGVGARLRTEHLEVQVIRVELQDGLGHPELVPHLGLSIRNRSDRPLAYRVVTSVPDADLCETKRDLAHNALALRPGEELRRTECLLRGRRKPVVTVALVEVYEVTELGRALLTRLQPHGKGPFDMRVAGGHDRGDDIPACPGAQWEPGDADSGDWRRLIEFYARHDCEDYALPSEYSPWDRRGALDLPVCAPERR